MLTCSPNFLNNKMCIFYIPFHFDYKININDLVYRLTLVLGCDIA